MVSASCTVRVSPQAQRFVNPDMGGTITTLTWNAAKHVFGMVYTMVSRPPAIPETRPAEPTVATEVLVLLQAPPEVKSDKCVVVPGQRKWLPVMPAGTGLIVTGAETVQPPPSE